MVEEAQDKLLRPVSEEHERKPQISPLRCAPVRDDNSVAARI